MAIDIKQQYRRFRAWQREPFNHELKSEEQQHCANCHQDYTGNFCPYCSQKAGLGKVTWASVTKGISIVYGMDSRSLLYSLLQLLLRPGYLISDYINGERQSSFPPVKMLLLVAIIYGLILHWTGLRRVPSDPEKDFEFIREFALWFNNNPGWGQLIKCAFLILPTWLFFRYSPRNTRHSLPEGFYIQVFMTTLVLMIMIVTEKFLGDHFYWVLLFYYIIAYHQLFGYGWWGTIWRTALVGFEGFFLLLTISMAVETIYGKPLYEDSIQNWTFIAGVLIINTVIVAVCYYICRLTSTRALALSKKKQPEPQENMSPEDESLEEIIPIDEPQLDELQDELLLGEEPPEDEEPQETEPADNDNDIA